MLTSIKNINFVNFRSSNPPGSRRKTPTASQSDPIEISSGEDTADSFDYSKLPRNFKRLSNANFLYDRKLSIEDKFETLSKHPEILSITQLEKENGFPHGFLMLKDFFSIDKFYSFNHVVSFFINTYDEINRKNLDIILANKDNIISLAEYVSLLGINTYACSNCWTKGFNNRLKLYSKDGELRSSPLVLLSENEGRKNIKNAFRIGQITKYYAALTSSNYKPEVYANIGALSKLGFGDAKTLYSLIKTGKIDGRIIPLENNGNKKLRAEVNLASRRSESVLKALRNKTSFEVSEADNLFGLTRQELCEAFCFDEIDCYTDAVFVGDLDKIFIDMKSPRNKDAFNKLLFQKELLHGLNDNNLYDAKTCQRIKLAWYFAPKTRAIAQKLAADDPKVLKILSNKQQRDNQCKEFVSPIIPDSKISSDERDISLLRLHQKINQENMYLRKFFEKVWDEAGFDEYNEALLKAETYINLPVDSIKDKTLKNIAARSFQTANRDFLPYT